MSSKAEALLRIETVEGLAPEKSLSFSFRKMVGARKLPRSKWRRLQTHSPPIYAFEVPAVPDGFAIAAEIDSKWYRRRYSETFSLKGGEQKTFDASPLFRDPGKWRPTFTKWANLGQRFDPLKTVLKDSPELRVRGWKSLGTYVTSTYDDATDTRINKAKAGLLNLFAKLLDTKEPIYKRKPWFAFIEEILEIGSERLIARVQPDMATRVFLIHEKISQFAGEYERSPVGEHADNIPAKYNISKIKSLKSDEKKANLQLTVAETTHRETGEAATFLDADIDESGELVPHLIEAFLIHPFSGGTHPHDIREYLLELDPSLELGYKLVPKE